MEKVEEKERKIMERLKELEVIKTEIKLMEMHGEKLAFTYNGQEECEELVEIITSFKTIQGETKKILLYLYLKEYTWYPSDVEHARGGCPFCGKNDTYEVCSFFDQETIKYLFNQVFPFVRLKLLFMNGEI